MSAPETVMRERCDGCAFRAGTEANRDPLTQATAKMCLVAREPFFCHHADAQKQDGSGPDHLCRGWVDALGMEMRKARPAWHTSAAQAILATMEDIAEMDTSGGPINEGAFAEYLLRNLDRFRPDADHV